MYIFAHQQQRDSNGYTVRWRLNGALPLVINFKLPEHERELQLLYRTRKKNQKERVI